MTGVTVDVVTGVTGVTVDVVTVDAVTVDVTVDVVTVDVTADATEGVEDVGCAEEGALCLEQTERGAPLLRAGADGLCWEQTVLGGLHCRLASLGLEVRLSFLGRHLGRLEQRLRSRLL